MLAVKDRFSHRQLMIITNTHTSDHFMNGQEASFEEERNMGVDDF